MSGGVWVFAEQKDNEVLDASLELVCEARRLADGLKQPLSVVVLAGSPMPDRIQSLSFYGVNTAYGMSHPALSDYHPEFYTSILSGLARSHGPSLLLLSETSIGLDLGPRIAAKLKTSLVPNCDKTQGSPEGLLFTRLTHQNKVLVTLACPDAGPILAMTSPGISKIKKTEPQSDFTVVLPDPSPLMNPDNEKIKKIRFIPADPKTVDISIADRIISGGKGASDKNGFELIHELADVLGAAAAGSRVAVDNQWISRDRQIGQSGKTVAPALMISCGISGAGAHVFGMRETKTLIAVNTDKAAPIMKIADLGVVGDLHAILPELIKRLKEKGSRGQGVEGSREGQRAYGKGDG